MSVILVEHFSEGRLLALLKKLYKDVKAPVRENALAFLSKDTKKFFSLKTRGDESLMPWVKGCFLSTFLPLKSVFEAQDEGRERERKNEKEREKRVSVGEE